MKNWFQGRSEKPKHLIAFGRVTTLARRFRHFPEKERNLEEDEYTGPIEAHFLMELITFVEGFSYDMRFGFAQYVEDSLSPDELRELLEDQKLWNEGRLRMPNSGRTPGF